MNIHLPHDLFFQADEICELRIPSQRLLFGDCMQRLKELPDNSIDSVVCDPPYHLQSIVKRFSAENAAPAKSKQSGVYARASKGFMGKTWDGGDIAFNPEMWAECLRVLKAGGHLIAFGGTRTIHRIACAIEDAGFEIRDMIAWCYYSGFPKSLDISKQIDCLAINGKSDSIVQKQISDQLGGNAYKRKIRNNGILGNEKTVIKKILTPQTEEAQRWEGWGTALKPAYEPAILARKPIEEGSIARQVLSTGTGAINIDECRFGYGDPAWIGPQNDHSSEWNRVQSEKSNIPFVAQKSIDLNSYRPNLGRWPANIYQCPKASRREREQGLEHLEPISGADAVGREEGSAGIENPRAGAGRTASEIKNTHPTVKPLGLMRWLCRLITPKGGTVLDPFSGSGSTLAAATLEGFDSIGCELTAEYVPIIEGRIKWAREEYFNLNAQLDIPW